MTELNPDALAMACKAYSYQRLHHEAIADCIRSYLSALPPEGEVTRLATLLRRIKEQCDKEPDPSVRVLWNAAAFEVHKAKRAAAPSSTRKPKP